MKKALLRVRISEANKKEKLKKGGKTYYKKGIRIMNRIEGKNLITNLSWLMITMDYIFFPYKLSI